MCFVGFNSMPNLIVTLFNLLYPVFIVGFNCKSCVIERESVKTQAIEDLRFLVSCLLLSILWSDVCALHMTRMRRVSTNGDTRETFCFSRLCYLIHTFYTHTIYTHITHKCEGVLLRENPNQTPWELEIVIPTYLYTFAYGFPHLLPLHFHTIERLIAQTLTMPFQSVKWGFGAVGKHWKKPGFGGCNRAYCGIRKARQDMVPRSLVGVGAWRA